MAKTALETTVAQHGKDLDSFAYDKSLEKLASHRTGKRRIPIRLPGQRTNKRKYGVKSSMLT